MVEPRIGEDFEAGAHGAAFGILSAVDESGDAGLDYGARTHAAGFDGHVEGGVSKPVVAETVGGFTKGDNFRVRRWVIVANRAVVRTDKDPAVVDQYGADGNFAGFSCRTRLGKRFLHELGVRLHHRRENIMQEEEKRN